MLLEKAGNAAAVAMSVYVDAAVMLGFGNDPEPRLASQRGPQRLHNVQRDVGITLAVDHKHRLADAASHLRNVQVANLATPTNDEPRPAAESPQRMVGKLCHQAAEGKIDL